MAKISLREYNREIETLIDQGSYEKAIDLCRYILKLYPKHIDTYRLLGKAFLESHRYGEAIDILERVISSLPGDFIAHVGMSIIREDEGNLDAAIWHMERAYESQPANQAIQGELRRLYGRRDGFEPPKIRLTRGALARMYFKGDLYPQAIAETRAALAEDPNRLDLQSLLAETYFQAGQKVEAAEAASTLLNKLPFSLVANRILSEVLKNSERAEESLTYRQRAIALDPYEGERTASQISSVQVPDDAILLEELDWKPGRTPSIPSQPDWATSLGIGGEIISSDEADERPDWLKQIDEFKMPQESSTEDHIEAEIEPTLQDQSVEIQAGMGDEEEVIPDWMKAAGWEPGTTREHEEETTFTDSELPDAMQSTEIPDWVRAMAPTETGKSEDDLSETTPEDIPWMEETPADAIVEETPEDTGADFDLALNEESAPPQDTLPDWLQDLAPAETLAESEPGFEEQSAAQVVAEDEELPEEEFDLEELAGTLPPVEQAGAEEQVLGETLSPLAVETEAGAAETPDASLQDDEAFDWIDNLVAPQDADQALPLEPADRLEEPSDWIPETMAEEEIKDETIDFQSKFEPEQAGEVPSDNIPAWLQEADEETGEQVEIPETAIDESSEILDLMKTSDEEAELHTEAGTGSDEESAAIKPETQIAEKEAESVTSGSLIQEERVSSEREAEREEDVQPGTSTAPGEDWLTIEEPPLITGDTKPTSPLREPATPHFPDWLQGLEEDEIPEPPEDFGEIGSRDIEGKAVPDWLEELADEIETPEVSEASQEESFLPKSQLGELDELPDWLSSLAPDEVASVEQAEEDISTQIVAGGTESPETDLPVIESAEESPLDEAEAPGLSEADENVQEDDEAFAWLEGLAAQQGEADIRQDEAPEAILETEDHIPEEIPSDLTSDLSAMDLAESQISEGGLSEEEVVQELEAPEASIPFSALETPAKISDQLVTPPDSGIEEAPEAIADDELPELPSWLEGIDEQPSSAEISSEWQPEQPDIALESPGPLPITESPVSIERLDLNSAGLGQLERLPGVGYTRAAALAAYLETHGPIHDMNELKHVAGFDDELITNLADYVTINLPEPSVTGSLISGVSYEITLLEARNALAEGDQEASLEAYNRLIEHKQFLPEVISDLHEALYRFPVDISIWQALGDAYASSDQFQAALDAYNKAEELLK